jgi:serine/threonine-protein kinase
VESRILERYAMGDPIAAGGMATVHIGRQRGHAGFARVVAIKRLLPHMASEPEFVSMLVDEARLASRIHHPNVVQTFDVVTDRGEVFLVLEYVHGESLANLATHARQSKTPIPAPIVSAIVGGVLHGLHAAHEAVDERGLHLALVHRDVSPHNVVVGVDGVARLLDFGVAKAAGRLQTTREGQVKGKLAYMAPELLQRHDVTPLGDVYAAGVVLWECLANRRLFSAPTEAALLAQALVGLIDPPSKYVPKLPEEVDALVMKALARDPGQRFASAREMAQALERLIPPALNADVGAFVQRVAAAELARRVAIVARVEASADTPAAMVAPAPAVADTSMPSVATEPPSRRRTTLFAGTAVALALALASFVAGRTFSRDGARRGAEAPAGREAEAPATTSPPAQSATNDTTNAAAAAGTSASGAATPAAGAPGAASDPPAAAAGHVTSAPRGASPSRGHVKRPMPPPPSPAPRDDCAEPFTRDASGMKLYKRACLNKDADK